MSNTWHLYPLNPSFLNTPQQSFAGSDPPTTAAIKSSLGITNCDNIAMTRVNERYYLFSYAYPAEGSPSAGNNVACVYACIRT